MSIDYEFDWDDAKAAANEAKHGVTFLEPMTVLSDALAVTFLMRSIVKTRSAGYRSGKRAKAACWW
jgi:uncharacterized DUF497 family protein